MSGAIATLSAVLFAAGQALAVEAKPDAGKPGRPEACAVCHAGLSQAKLSAPALAHASDTHGKAGVGCTACHGGDGQAKDKAVAHLGTFLARPAGGEAVLNLCGRCHTPPAEGYTRSPHNLSRDPNRHPTCVTCHGAHGVAEASLAIIAEPLCNRCHDIHMARRLLKSLSFAERQLGELEGEIEAKGGFPAEAATLRGARTSLRGLSHALDLNQISRKAAESVAIADEVRAKVGPRVAGLRLGLVVRWTGIGLGALFALLVAGWGVVWALRRAQAASPTTRRRLAILGAVAAVLAAGAGLAGFRAFDYIEHNPRFCLSCHTMSSAYDAWTKTGHREVNCHTCHPADPMANLHQLWLYSTKRPDAVAMHAWVNRDVCLQCHENATNANKWNLIVQTAGHKTHVRDAKIECIQCHSVTVHRFKPPEDVCKLCHKPVTLASAGGMSEFHCNQCHNFLAEGPKSTLGPDRKVCLQCHEKRTNAGLTFPAEGPMQWACGRCHKPHTKMKIASEDCRACHEVTQGVHEVEAHKDADCVGCHRAHGWTIEGRKTCAPCHGAKEKHHPDKPCAECHNAG